MKILIRNTYNDWYAWKTAKYTKDGFVVDGEIVREDQIVSIQNDNRDKYVRCSHCTEIVHKDKIAEHREKHKNSDGCLNCPHMSASWAGDSATKYTKGKDGKYTMTVKKEVNLYCNAGFVNRQIDSNEARETCWYSGCKDAVMLEISDIFTTHKGLFDDIALENVLADVGYDKQGSYSDGYWKHYRLNTNKEIYACVNNLGIIDHFDVNIAWDDYRVFYSKKFDKIYTSKNRKYVEGVPYLTKEENEEIKNEIRKLYI